MSYIIVRDLYFRYFSKHGTVEVLKNLNMEISKQCFVALVGPSGCGKTTVLKLIAGLLKPTTGTILVNGNVVNKPLERASMVFQSPLLLPWRKVLDNILLPYEFQRQKPAKAHLVERARELLAMTGLKDFGHRYPWELSGGMQQRVALCRALIINPEILLMDEPFGALDPFTREELWTVTQELYLSKSFTAILVTHDIREAVFLSAEVFVMSPRPSTIIYHEIIPFAFPRRLPLVFSETFKTCEQRIRSHIGGTRAPS